MSEDDKLNGVDLGPEEGEGEDFDPEFDEDLGDEDVDLDDADLDDDADSDEEDADDGPERAPKRPATGDQDLDDEVDPDNLEADLNTILRDRIAAGDDLAGDEDDGEEETEGSQPAEMLGTVTPRRDDEWLCEGCFLLVSKSQLGSRADPRCPSGEEICPSLDRLGP